MKQTNCFQTLLLGFLLVFSSCSKGDFKYVGTGEAQHADGNKIVFQLRKTPRRIPPKPPVRGGVRALDPDDPDLRLSPYNYLGVSYVVGDGILGSPSNLRNSIIDMNKLLADNLCRRFLYVNPVDETKFEMSTHEYISSYSRNIRETKKVSTGFSLNFGVFEIGARSTHRKVFVSDVSDSLSLGWGQANLSYVNSKVGFDATNASLSLLRNFLDESFLFSLYNTTISDYIHNNGFLFVGNYLVGGKLTALYEVVFKQDKESKKVSRVNTLDVGIRASLGWGGDDGKTPKGKDSLSIGWRDTDRNNESWDKAVSSMRGYAYTIGGAKEESLPGVVFARETSNRLSLGRWYASLTNKTNHRFIDVGEGGLIGIDKLLLEANFKYRIQYTLTGELPHLPRLQSPKVEIRNVETSVYGGSFVEAGITAAATVLHTRQGDKILILDKDWSARLNTDSFEDPEKTKARYLRDTKILRERISSVFSNTEIYTNNYHGDYIDNEQTNNLKKHGLWIGLAFSFSSEHIAKFKNPKTNIWYIYDKESKTGFSYYDHDDSGYILDEYGISDWVAGLPVKSISLGVLSNYKIIGL